MTLIEVVAVAMVFGEKEDEEVEKEEEEEMQSLMIRYGKKPFAGRCCCCLCSMGWGGKS